MAILAADGKPIPGFTVKQCRIINGDFLDKVVAWQDGADVSGLGGQPVRLRFEMRGTKLYSFRFAQRDLSAAAVRGVPEDRKVEQADNVAPSAHVTASSEHDRGFAAAKAVDRIVPGYTRPVGLPQFEWASDGEQAGAWLKLEWQRPVVIAAVTLYDRPNPVDQVLAATLRFSDGTTVNAAELANDGRAGTTIELSAKRTTSLQVTIEKVSPTCSNAGLAEIVVCGRLAEVKE